MRKLLREPLLHFLLLGFGLFLLHGWMVGSCRRVRQEHRHHPGTNRAAGCRLRAYASARTGGERARGPDRRCDPRGNLLSRSQGTGAGPGRHHRPPAAQAETRVRIGGRGRRCRSRPMSQLRAYLQAHPEKFRSEARYSLSQVYLNPQRHGQRLAGDTQVLLAQLQRVGATADASKLGDAFLLEHRFQNVTASELVRLFGAGFETALRDPADSSNGRGRCLRATACTWSSSTNAMTAGLRHWNTCVTRCAANGSMTSVSRRTNASMRTCASATR